MRGQLKFLVVAFILFGVLTGMLQACSDRGATAPGDGSGIPWRTDVEAARAEAAASGKPLFLDFTASWCPPCREMDAETWPDPAVRALLTDRFTPVKVDIDDDPSSAQSFGVRAIPTLVVVAEDAPERRRTGFVAPAEMAVWLREQVPAAEAGG